MRIWSAIVKAYSPVTQKKYERQRRQLLAAVKALHEQADRAYKAEDMVEMHRLGLIKVLGDLGESGSELAKMEAANKTAARKIAELEAELDYVRRVWHPPTIQEAFEAARAELNDDYWPVQHAPSWSRVDNDPIETDNPLLGEQPPIDAGAVWSGSLGFDEYPPNVGSPSRHEGPGL